MGIGEPTGEKQQPAKEYLVPDQNFFDQSPFNIVRNLLRQRHHLSEELVGYTISQVAEAKALLEENETSRRIMDQQEAIATILFKTPQIRVKLGMDSVMFRKYVSECLTLLGKFPLWDEYVRTQKVELYNSDGEPDKRSAYYPQATYRKWVKEHLARKDRLKVAGVRELIEQTPHAPAKGARNARDRLDRIKPHV